MLPRSPVYPSRAFVLGGDGVGQSALPQLCQECPDSQTHDLDQFGAFFCQHFRPTILRRSYEAAVQASGPKERTKEFKVVQISKVCRCDVSLGRIICKLYLLHRRSRNAAVRRSVGQRGNHPAELYRGVFLFFYYYFVWPLHGSAKTKQFGEISEIL